MADSDDNIKLFQIIDSTLNSSRLSFEEIVKIAILNSINPLPTDKNWISKLWEVTTSRMYSIFQEKDIIIYVSYCDSPNITRGSLPKCYFHFKKMDFIFTDITTNVQKVKDDACELHKLRVKDRGDVHRIDEVIAVVKRARHVYLMCLADYFNNKYGMSSKDFGNLCKAILSNVKLQVHFIHQNRFYFTKELLKQKRCEDDMYRKTNLSVKAYDMTVDSKKRKWNDPDCQGRIKCKPGCVGLRNLGNTCFMNSGLQCLFSNSVIAKYFIEDFKIDQTDKESLAGCFADMVRKCWTGKHKVLVPGKFREFFLQSFPKHQEHDCHEFLLTCLDRLDEEMYDSKMASNNANALLGTRSCQQISESEEDYLKRIDKAWTHREQTVIGQTFKGLFKDTLECHACRHRSVSITPFSHIGVPIPKDTQLRLSVILMRNFTSKATRYIVTVDRNSNVAQLREAVRYQASMKDSVTILIAGVKYHYIAEILSDKTIIKDIDPTYQLYALEFAEGDYSNGSSQNLPKDVSLSSSIQCGQDKTSMIQLHVMFRLQSGDTSTDLFGHPNVIHHPKQTTGIELCHALKRIHGFDQHGKGFKVLTTDSKGLYCSRCTNFCMGCELRQDNSRIDLETEDHLAVTYCTLTEKEVSEANKVGGNQDKADTTAPPSLLECIESSMQSDTITWDCPMCKKSRDATKTMTVWKYPNTLIVHLMRFSFDGKGAKIRSEITFPVKDLDLSHLGDNLDDQPLHFNLQSCACHYGNGLNEGHYTALSKNVHSGEWIQFNDQSYEPEDPSDAHNSAAYLLFYQRKESFTTFELPKHDDNHPPPESPCHSLSKRRKNTRERKRR